MKRIALIGANSQISKDWIRSVALNDAFELLLFVRNVGAMNDWLAAAGLAGRYPVLTYAQYVDRPHDVVINFVGVGDPSRAALMGADILDITLQFDSLVLGELKNNPRRRYIFISSGAVYGENFYHPVTNESSAVFSVNAIAPQSYYAIAKLHAEVRHRALANLAIIDLRVFNYFSRYQSLDSRFFIVDVINSIRSGSVFQTSADSMSRDFLHPSDFYELINCLLTAAPQNGVLDCYSAAPVEKLALLENMREHFSLDYEVVHSQTSQVNATGIKPYYFSKNKRAAEFGYQPRYTSLETLQVEISALLGNGLMSK